MKDHVRTYKEIGEFVMSKIAELGEQDRAAYGSLAAQPTGALQRNSASRKGGEV
jgi:hypothetical protein